MSNNSLNVIDPRIIETVRGLKDQQVKTIEQLSKKQDISSEKTSENSAKVKEEQNNKLPENEVTKKLSRDKKLNKLAKINNNINENLKKSTKISIDGSKTQKMKSGTSESNKRFSNSLNNKIQIVSREKVPSNNLINTFQSSLNLTNGRKKFVNIKARSKYVQNLLNDASIKKYKKSCIDLIKNDIEIKKMYENCGFEKTNYNYENFINSNFFNKPLFMYKLEMLFLDESNFSKKNFKENFFKNEILNYLVKYHSENSYQVQINSVNNVFSEAFEQIKKFDLFHD